MIPGTEGYAEQAAELVGQYESVPFVEKHQAVLHLLPTRPCHVLDIGAGTGADAAWFAGEGHSVVAVEPTREFRQAGMALHPSPLIEWVDDSLPGLDVTRRRIQRFDLICLSAVWMHLDEHERRLAMPNVASLLAAAGVLLLSLRHGPMPAGRRMFEVTAEETARLARSHGLETVLSIRTQSTLPRNRLEGVEWSRMAFVPRSSNN